MHRAGSACLLAAVIFGALNCNSTEPGQEPAQATENQSTAVRELTTQNCSSCLDLHLGDFNLFLLEDFTEGHDIQGKVAAGGNITLSGFSVGTRVPPGDISNTLVAGGDLTLTDGAVYGDARYRGRYTPTRVGYTQGGTVAQGTPIDFADRFAVLRSLSTQLASQQLTGTTRRETWGGLKMNGTDPCMNVFEVNASAFTGTVLWEIAVPAGSFAVVNIRGTPPTFNSFDLPSNNISPQRVLYNFVDATTLHLENRRLTGTVLAPYARVVFRNGIWYGGIYAVSLTGNATGNLSPLDELVGGVCQEGDTASCTTSCGSTGTQVCNALCTWEACTPPSAEACNGVDDTCNGQIDEGFECAGASTRSCTAWCGLPGSQACDPTTCSYGACTSLSCCHTDADCGGGSYCEGTTCTAQRGNGASCSRATQCASGQCVDGVCCNSACAGACDICDQAGSVGTCSFTPATVQCRASQGTCDVAEYCTGTNASCPADALLPSGAACPPDGDDCTQDVCDGTGLCTHPPAPVGANCNDGNSCTSGDVCNGAGTCGGAALSCNSPPSQCHQAAGTCSNGTCSYAPKSTGASCDDGNSCTSGDVCNGAGTCGGAALSCNSPLSQCHEAAGTCSNGTCSYAPKPAGASCDDGNSCTSGDVCNGAGTCGGAALSCNSPPSQCHEAAGTCSNGTCSYAPKPAGTSCNDGYSCTNGDACNNSGTCSGNVVLCDQLWVTALVPAGKTLATFSLWGAGGGGGLPGPGGGGAWVNARIPVTPGDRLDILVGHAGLDGTGGGGGASYVYLNRQLILVAAGGGSAGVDGCGGCSSALDPLAGAGGGGGAARGNGQAGTANNYADTNSGGGQGGTQSAGGAGGTSNNNSPYSECSSPGLPGSLLHGGAVRTGCTNILIEAIGRIGGQASSNGSGGGGGSGLYGGGSGGQLHTRTGGGGGGGSSWIHPSATLLGTEGGNGQSPGGVTSPFYSGSVGRGGDPLTRGSNGLVVTSF